MYLHNLKYQSKLQFHSKQICKKKNNNNKGTNLYEKWRTSQKVLAQLQIFRDAVTI